MKNRLLDQGNIMEIGLVVFGAAVLAAVIALVSGRVMTGVRRAQGRSQEPPAPSGVSNERHRNISTVAAR